MSFVDSFTSVGNRSWRHMELMSEAKLYLLPVKIAVKTEDARSIVPSLWFLMASLESSFYEIILLTKSVIP